MKTYIIILALISMSFSSCGIFFQSDYNSRFAKQELPLDLHIDTFEAMYGTPTSRNMRIENGQKVVNLHYVENIGQNTFVKSNFTFINDRLVSQEQSNEIIRQAKIECKHN